MEVEVENKTTETQLQAFSEPLGRIDERECGCGCGKPMIGYHKKRKYRPECLDGVDKRRRKERRERQEKESAERTEQAWREYQNNNPDFYIEVSILGLVASTHGNRFSVRGAFYKLREKGFHVPNAFSRHCALDLIADHPELASLITVKK